MADQERRLRERIFAFIFCISGSWSTNFQGAAVLNKEQSPRQTKMQAWTLCSGLDCLRDFRHALCANRPRIEISLGVAP